MTTERATHGMARARLLVETARAIQEQTSVPVEIETRRAMGQMIADGALLFQQAVLTIDRMRHARSMERARQIANEFLADLGR